MIKLIETPDVVDFEYPLEMEIFFTNEQLKIPTLPTEFRSEITIECFPMEIGSAQQYYDYLQQEISFWKANDPQNKLSRISHIANLNSALSSFNAAVDHAKSSKQNNLTNMKAALNSSVNEISSNGSLYSKLQLTQFVLSIKDKDAEFISGVRLHFLKSTTSTNVPSKLSALNGYFAAMEYSKALEAYKNKAEDLLLNFQNNLKEASANYSALNESYSSFFREQQERIQEIQNQTNIHFDDLQEKKDAFFNSANQRMSDLEYLYSEKLKLSEPAQYWDEMEIDYKHKGTKWLLISCGLAFFTIVGLICIILLIPQLFAKDASWIENIKTSVVITIITSISVYMLRLCVKMSTTSFHLSRDAKERSKLSYFYLALIEKDAVSDKERALVLNALFSRSDTGLLKGDSSPSMPSNISDLITIIGKNSETK